MTLVEKTLFRHDRSMNVEVLIQKMGLQPLPMEGGYYRRSYTSSALHPASGAACSAIYYLITAAQGSFLHCLREAEELFHFYAGDPVEMIYWAEGDPAVRYPPLGNRIEQGEEPQVLIPAGVWQGMRLRAAGRWALLGTTVCPAWEGAGFELADNRLLERAPAGLRATLAPWLANA